MAPTSPQDGLRRRQTALRAPEDGPRGAKKPQRGPQEVLRRQNILMSNNKCLKIAKLSSAWVSKRPKTAQAASKISPRQPARLPRGPQICPIGPQDCPRDSQKGPKTAQRGPQDGLRRRQTGQGPPKTTQETPRGPQEASKRAPRRPPGKPDEAKTIDFP